MSAVHTHRTFVGAAIATVGAVALLLTACGDPGASPPATAPFDTLPGVGQVPQPLSFGPETTDETTTTETTEPRDTVDRPDDLGLIGERVEGNRLIVIGDSITASTARRYGGEMCFTLLPLGWAVEVNAEVARFVDFGHRVLDRRLRPDDSVDWDAAVVFLGSNYGGDADRYRAELHGILDRLEPRPTLLVTVTEFRPNRAEVNEVIRGMLDFYPQVEVLDWAEITRAERDLLSGDGLHLSPDGRARLAGEIAFALGPAPEPDAAAGDDLGDRPAGECLSTQFTDDSAGARPGAAPTPPTLVAGGGGGGDGGGGDGGGGNGDDDGSPTTTVTTTSQPVGSTGATTPATTSPATTAPPTTDATTTSTTTATTSSLPPPTITPVTTQPATTSSTTTTTSTTIASSTTAPATTPPGTDPPADG